MTFSRSIVAASATLALLASFVPAFASAQYYNSNYNASYNSAYCNTYPYGSNTYPYNYNNTYPYTNSYYNGNCPPGNLFVYVQVNALSSYSHPPSDFTISVTGANVFPATFPGSANGQLIYAQGTYTVTAVSFQGYTPSYSSGCSGTLALGQQATCVITENSDHGYLPPSYPTYPPYQPTYPQQVYPYVYQQPLAPQVYVTPTYVPQLPNTGFEPLNASAIVFALVALIAFALATLPYVRKAFAALLG